MPKGKRIYAPKFMIDEINRIQKENMMMGKRDNVKAMKILVSNARIGQEMERMRKQIEFNLGMGKKNGRKKQRQW